MAERGGTRGGFGTRGGKRRIVLDGNRLPRLLQHVAAVKAAEVVLVAKEVSYCRANVAKDSSGSS